MEQLSYVLVFPQLRLGSRPILLVTDASGAAGELRALARWRARRHPYVVAVDGSGRALKARRSML